MKSATPELSVVIPVYRSRDTINPLVERLLAVVRQVPVSAEIILVNDGSPDDTWSVVRQVQQVHPDDVIAINLMRNFGQHNALMCGFRHARGEYIVTMDDDLQNPPEEIPKLLQSIRQTGLDLVYGQYAGKQHASWRNLGSLVVNSFYRLVFHTTRTVTSFRIIRRPLVQSILPYDLNFTYIDGLLAWNTQQVGEVLVDHRPRATGRSGYSLGKLLNLSLNLFTNFSLLPLQLVSAVGFLVACCGILAAGFYLLRYLMADITVPGFASLIIAILVMGGLQLLSLGMIGEYLGRLHLNVNRKPQYTVREILGATEIRQADSGPAAPASRQPSQPG